MNSSLSTSTSSVRSIPIGRPLARVMKVILRLKKFRTVMLVGRTGIGKSEFVKSFGRALGLEVTVLDLAAMDPPDLSGLPQIVDGKTTFAVPSWLPVDGRGILFLDELNRAPLEVQQALYRLVLEGKLHEYTLPPGWIVWAAINPADDGDYQVTELDPALVDRFRKLSVVADRQEWLRWAKEHDIHPAVLAVVREHEAVFEQPSPRAWERTSETLSMLDDDEFADDEFVRNLCTPDVGEAWMETLLHVLRDMGPDALVDASTLLATYDEHDALRETLIGYHQLGQSDRLAALTERLIGVLAGPELEEMIDAGQFDLDRFERLADDMHGDYARRLRLALGNNPAATRLLAIDGAVAASDIDRDDFEGSELGAKFAEWSSQERTEHRALLVATALAEHVRRRPDLARLRRRKPPRRYLGAVLRKVGRTRATWLVATLERLRIRVEEGGPS